MLRLLILINLILVIFPSAQALLQENKKAAQPIRVGEESRGPWWMKQTALSAEGRLASLKGKSWWKKTLELKPGESMILEEKGEAKDRMAVRIESYGPENGEKTEVLVWVIDDDGDQSLKTGGDFHDDCYVYDFNRDGQAELMVDYADQDGNGQADFMEVRYFERGYLTRVWIGYDLENVGELFKFRNPLELLAEKLDLNLNGKKIYSQNVYDQAKKSWAPSEICPLASLDLNGDGLSEMIVRFNLDGDPSTLAIRSLEISLDADRSANLENPFHYDLGLVLEGRRVFDLNEFKIYSSKRRPPQEVFFVPYEKIMDLIKEYSVQTAGFSWKEFPEASQKGMPENRWKSQEIGWLFERRTLFSSSDNIQKWNVRREIAEGLENSPEFYYSDLDQRIHIFQAKEGWLPIGYVAGLPRLGELRYFDTDGDGFFDRREVYLVNSSRPVLVLVAKDEKATKIPFEFNFLSDFYLKKALPEALSRSEKLLSAMRKVYNYEPPPEYESALNKSTLSEKRYLQEIYVLLYFISLRDHFLTMANQTLFKDLSENETRGDLHPKIFRDPRQVASPLSSDRAWRLVRLVNELEQAYAQGDSDRFLEIINRIKELQL